MILTMMIFSMTIRSIDDINNDDDILEDDIDDINDDNHIDDINNDDNDDHHINSEWDKMRSRLTARNPDFRDKKWQKVAKIC